ncbi:hypothetical protein VTL71DRAFT_757 [Oculimacula yallundae]|uniref:Uncharacterized protein n=1 Tax=Oculimacula yallundae TaxID=86028 RepID=A0ABR4D3A1_9HELO
MSNHDSTDISMADRDLMEENRRLKDALEECKAELIELLQDDTKVSDATIIDGYRILCDSIEQWIGSVSHSEEDDFFSVRFEKILERERRNPQGILNDLDLLHGLKEPTLSSKNWADLLERQDSSNLVILSVVIWNHLDSNIFKKEFPIGTTGDVHVEVEESKSGSKEVLYPGQTTLFRSMLEVMERKYRNREGSRRVDKWRSETLSAIVETSGFQAHQTQKIKDIERTLLNKLDDWISHSTLDSSASELLQDIIVPAVKLHQDMKCSGTDYDLSHAGYRRGESPASAGFWTAKDIKTWTELSKTDLDWVAFHHQFPGLYRLDTSGPVELTRPIIIVVMKRDLPPPSVVDATQNISRRVVESPDRTESSQSDSQRTSQRKDSKSESRRKGRKQKHKEDYLYDALESDQPENRSEYRSREGSPKKVGKPALCSKSHMHHSASETRPHRSRRGSTAPGLPAHGTQDIDQITVEEEPEDGEGYHTSRTYTTQLSSKSVASTQSPEGARPLPGERKKSTSKSFLKRFTGLGSSEASSRDRSGTLMGYEVSFTPQTDKPSVHGPKRLPPTPQPKDY